MKNLSIKSICLLVLFVILVSSVNFSIAASKTDLNNQQKDLNGKINDAQKELENSKSKVENAKKSRQVKSNELKAAKTNKNSQVANLSKEEKEIQAQLDEFEADKKSIQKELARIAAEEAKQNQGNGGISKPNNPSASGFIKPVVGYSITTGFHGYSGHTGVDYSGSGIRGKNILAVKDGTVVTSKALIGNINGYKSYGEYIVINHHDGTMTLYAHGLPGSRKVSVGQKVKQGQPIMSVGNTGNVRPRPSASNPTAGTHLHFEVIVNGVPQDASKYVPK